MNTRAKAIIVAAIGFVVADLVGKRMIDRANEIEESKPMNVVKTNGPDELRAVLEEFFEPELFDLEP